MATQKAIDFFKSLSAEEKKEVAKASDISLGRLRNIFYNGATPSMKTACKIEKACKRKITRYEIAPEIDWSVL